MSGQKRTLFPIRKFLINLKIKWKDFLLALGSHQMRLPPKRWEDDTKVNPAESAFNSHLQWLKPNIVVMYKAKCEQDETK